MTCLDNKHAVSFSIFVLLDKWLYYKNLTLKVTSKVIRTYEKQINE